MTVKMSSVETQSYVFDLRDALGSGSFGFVCVGHQRRTGEPVAVKVFKRNVPQRYLSQEFEVLKCVDHENIVRLISVDHHPQCGSFLVMELCAEGSLLNALQNPKNLYGLDEEEFLILLGDLTAGMKYLRGKNLIHRDIKPGNILRSRRRDGRVIYKLIDFGSARVLEDDESFSSIWGTAEYIHPDLYHAHTTKRKTRNFSATVDLWSIGVTLYHAATGKVPFKPPAMLSSSSSSSAKPKRAISGERAEPNGPIVWREELPRRCCWNPEFKVVITRLLRGLLEAEPALTWSFERFFREVDEIVSLRKIVVFHVKHLRFLGVYLKSGEGLPQLREAITRQTSLKPGDEQLLAYRCQLLSEAEITKGAEQRAESKRGGTSHTDAPGLPNLLICESPPTEAEPIISVGGTGAIESSESEITKGAEQRAESKRGGASHTDAPGLPNLLICESPPTEAEPIILVGGTGAIESSESEITKGAEQHAGNERGGASHTDAPGLPNLFICQSPLTKAEPIILLGGAIESSDSQITKGAEQRGDGRGGASELANFGAIELNESETKFLNIDPSQSSESTKELAANEYLNESVVDDLITAGGLCKSARGLFHSIVSQRQRTCQLKIECLIQLWRTLKRDARNKPRHAPELKNLEQVKARMFASLETVLSAGMDTRATLQDEDGVFKDFEETTRETKTLQAKLRAHRNSFLKSNLRKPLPVYLLDMTADLARLYSACEAQARALANHVRAWCEKVAIVLGEIKALEGHIDEWSDHGEKLADSLHRVTKRDELALSERLGLLEGVSREMAELVESQSSIIENVISAGDAMKISDD